MKNLDKLLKMHIRDLVLNSYEEKNKISLLENYILKPRDRVRWNCQVVVVVLKEEPNSRNQIPNLKSSSPNLIRCLQLIKQYSRTTIKNCNRIERCSNPTLVSMESILSINCVKGKFSTTLRFMVRSFRLSWRSQVTFSMTMVIMASKLSLSMKRVIESAWSLVPLRMKPSSKLSS